MVLASQLPKTLLSFFRSLLTLCETVWNLLLLGMTGPASRLAGNGRFPFLKGFSFWTS